MLPGNTAESDVGKQAMLAPKKDTRAAVRGTFSATVDEGDGTPGLLSGTVSGLFFDETHADIHLYPGGGGDRVHHATLLADTLTGAWDQPGSAGAGTFRAVRSEP